MQSTNFGTAMLYGDITNHFQVCFKSDLFVGISGIIFLSASRNIQSEKSQADKQRTTDFVFK